MKYELPKLPFALDALEPWMSAETLSYHHGKHHKGYVDKLNKLVPGTEFENMSLVEIVRNADGEIFDNAAQAWNHTFFWHCLSPKEGEPSPELLRAIERDFGSFAAFKKTFTEMGKDLFGSGWLWLTENDGKLKLEALSNAGNPLRNGHRPILTCDLWEHAYYIDHRNERPKFIDSFFHLANWSFAQSNFSTATVVAA